MSNSARRIVRFDGEKKEITIKSKGKSRFMKTETNNTIQENDLNIQNVTEAKTVSRSQNIQNFVGRSFFKSFLTSKTGIIILSVIGVTAVVSIVVGVVVAKNSSDEGQIYNNSDNINNQENNDFILVNDPNYNEKDDTGPYHPQFNGSDESLEMDGVTDHIEEDFEIDADDNTGEESFVLEKNTVYRSLIYINSK